MLSFAMNNAISFSKYRTIFQLYKKYTSLAKVASSKLTITSDTDEPRASEIIDVRSPDEFQEDHIPNAINLPVLSNVQRDDVGKCYNEVPFRARQMGAQLVTRNISDHIEEYFSQKDVDYHPLIYCWRGGQRSRSLALVLSEIGFDVFLLKGGYRTYRKQVIQDLANFPHQMQFRVISGLTGTGKTTILQALKERGEQVLDLEGCAHHKGSILGLWPEHEQPSQKNWESQLRNHLKTFSPDRPVWVESESRRIGLLIIPTDLFEQLCASPRFEINVPLSERVEHILKGYPHWMENVDDLCKTVMTLERYTSPQTVAKLCHLARHEHWSEFVEELLITHYDKTYKKSQKKNSKHKHVEQVHLTDLSLESTYQVVDQLLEIHLL